MATPRRKYRLADTSHSDIDLRDYRKIIIETVEKTVPGKRPKVFRDYYSIDLISHSESVALGRALAKVEELSSLGKSITIFRLFEGKVYASEAAETPISKKALNKPKGGRMR